MSRNLGEYSLSELDDVEVQKQLIEESDDPELLELVFERMRMVRKDSLDPQKE